MQGIFRRIGVAALVAAALLPISPARADWWSDLRLAKQGLNRAVREQWITTDEAADYRDILANTTATWRRLPGSRSSNVAAVLHDVAAQWQSYLEPRALALFSMLDMNARYLGSDPMPEAGSDVLGDEGVVYRSFPGRGLQFHPLGNFARLNLLLSRGRDTDAAILAAALIARGIPRSGGLVWEYYFPFGGGSAPWTSGMVQAVAARAFAVDGDLDEARKAYLALYRLSFPLSDGVWVRLYSFSNMAVLNAQLQAALSLGEYGRLNQDTDAASLATRLLQTAGGLFSRFDTGAWSRYELGGPESNLHYHVYVVNLLKRIARATGDPLWAARAERFERYTTEPPVLSASGPSRPVRYSARISFWLSKISLVRLRIGRSVTTATFSRGSHSLYWAAAGRRAGRYRVQLSAIDLAGNRAVKKLKPIVVRR